MSGWSWALVILWIASGVVLIAFVAWPAKTPDRSKSADLDPDVTWLDRHPDRPELDRIAARLIAADLYVTPNEEN